ncbi:hypothetical protein RFI_12065, partial [Reticulomyxa filosa]
ITLDKMHRIKRRYSFIKMIPIRERIIEEVFGRELGAIIDKTDTTKKIQTLGLCFVFIFCFDENILQIFEIHKNICGTYHSFLPHIVLETSVALTQLVVQYEYGILNLENKPKFLMFYHLMKESYIHLLKILLYSLVMISYHFQQLKKLSYACMLIIENIRKCLLCSISAILATNLLLFQWNQIINISQSTKCFTQDEKDEMQIIIIQNEKTRLISIRTIYCYKHHGKKLITVSKSKVIYAKKTCVMARIGFYKILIKMK